MNIKTTKALLCSIVALLTFLLCFQACDKDKNRSFLGSHLLKKNEVITTNDNGKKITVEVIEINDTRCPINADCIGVGGAKILIKFTDEQQEQTVELCRGGCYATNSKVNLRISLNAKDYDLVLQDILPFPVIPSETKEAQKAKIFISATQK